MRRWAARLGALLLLIAAGLALWAAVVWVTGPGVPPPTERARAHAANVRILRDRWGVPHVYGKTDADTAFGLAYAHAEDDFPLIQGVCAASRGQLGVHKPSQRALAVDFFTGFAGVEDEVERLYDEADPKLRALFEGYAEGLTFYAATHPDEADPNLLPFTGHDVARGFVQKLPLMLGLDKTLKALGDEPDLGEPVFPGSNSHAIAPWRSADGITRLNVNSHQPWEGPVTWYEAHVHSEEGWNAVGGTFPGAPLILHGHNEHVGWAMTVNHFDAIDVYALEIEGDRYRWDGGWEDLEERSITLPLWTPWGVLRIPQTVRWSAHGPVFERGERPYAVRWSSMGQGLAAAAQWYAMNRADSVDAFQAAMDATAIPMFNVVYASEDHIGFVYNGRIPDRAPGADYTTVLPGDDPALVWDDVLAYPDLPQVTDPASGWVQACNSSPWAATVPSESPDATAFPAEAGIETNRTNRTLRTHELLAGDAKVSRADLLALKWDDRLAAHSPMRTRLLEPLTDWHPEDPDLQRAREILLAWDGRFQRDRPGAALAMLAWQPRVPTGDDVVDDWALELALRDATTFLNTHFGRIEVPLGDVQRLRRGDVDLPIGGGPDILHCVYTEERDGRMVGRQGDSYVMLVEFAPSGVRSASIHQYGASSRPDSPHYADQAPLFVEQQLKPVLFRRADIERFLEADYAPGEPYVPRGIDPFQALEEARALGVF